MSIRALLWAVDHKIARPAEKLVLLCLSDYASTDNTAWPTAITIGVWTGLDDRTVRTALRGLEAAGIIADTGERRGATKQIKEYRLSVEDPPKGEPLKVDVFAGKTDVFVSKDLQKRVTEPVLKLLEPTTPPIVPQAGDIGFESFWGAYPKREARGDAEKAWRKLKPDAKLINTILIAISLQKQRGCLSDREGGKFIPHPASWLNSKRWNDELKPDREYLAPGIRRSPQP